MATSFSYMRERIRHTVGAVRSSRLHIKISAEVRKILESLAKQDGTRTEEYASALLSETVIERYHSQNENIRQWESLSEREKQVAALACMGHTNPQIAARLNITTETVKTHMKHILHKFNLKGRTQLSLTLQDWDFSNFLAS